MTLAPIIATAIIATAYTLAELRPLLAILYWPCLHWLGDYLLQNSWMAYGKGTKLAPALAHVVTYTCVFELGILALGFEHRYGPLLLIGLSHFVIDHYQLPALFAFVANGHLFHPYTQDGRNYQLLADWREWRIALQTRRWATLPSPIPLFVVRAIDQGAHLLCNAIALTWLLLG